MLRNRPGSAVWPPMAAGQRCRDDARLLLELQKESAFRCGKWDYDEGLGSGIIRHGTSSPIRLIVWPSAIFVRISRK